MAQRAAQITRLLVPIPAGTHRGFSGCCNPLKHFLVCLFVFGLFLERFCLKYVFGRQNAGNPHATKVPAGYEAGMLWLTCEAS